jgi:tyrosyl-tRNA synthetase
MEQFFKIVDKDKTEVRWQSEWFGKFDLADVIKLTSKFTIAQILARDDFSKRYNANQPITITEFLYPLLQAYDSVAINADVEFGGTDQKFNLLVGRELQTMLGQRGQQVLMVPLLVGTDGVHKMSKSLGNYIGVAETPENIFGKVMSIPDSIIMNYFELLTDVSDSELEEFRRLLDKNEINPMSLKKKLGKEIVTRLYDSVAAAEAEGHFSKVVQKKETPDEIEEYCYNLDGNVDLKDLLTYIKMARSRSDAGRLIDQGAVSINGQTVTVNSIKLESGCIVKVGKRRFAKIINSDINK